MMRNLASRCAVSLNGGISSQLLLRDDGHTQIGAAGGPYPVGLVAEPRVDMPSAR